MAGYFIEWGVYSGFTAHTIQANGTAAKLTHVLYAFSNLTADGTCQFFDTWADFERPFSAAESVDGTADGISGTLYGNFHQLQELKALNPNLKVLISIGGWTGSAGFSAAASTAALRQHTASTCINTFINGNFTDAVQAPGIFDGIDIDWEYPGACGNTCAYSPNDTENFTLLLQEFRNQLDALGATNNKHYLLTVAAPAGQQNYSLIELSKIHRYLDFINLMTYDIHGAWDNHADHAAPLFTSPLDPIAADKGVNADNAVMAYLAAGIPGHKINLGVPFYGHGWAGVPSTNNGLYQPATGPSAHDQANYNVLQTLTGFNHYYDPLSGMAHWIYNPTTGEFDSYDDPVTLLSKTLYIRLHGLGGAMFWDLSGDDSKATLVNTLYVGLH